MWKRWTMPGIGSLKDFIRTPRLLPQFGFCGHCIYKHQCAGVWALHCICIFGVNHQQCSCWVIAEIYFSLFGEPPHSFPEWLHQFTFPPTAQEGSPFSTSSPTFVVSCFVNFPHSNWCEWFLIVVLMCISLMASDAEHFLMSLLAMSVFCRNVSWCLLPTSWLDCLFLGCWV